MQSTIGRRFNDFINASEHFEKGKRQNRLREDDIEKIVESYQYRKEEERYSRRVSMAEIESNNYNLNISRYISTATAEEEIDPQYTPIYSTSKSKLSTSPTNTTNFSKSLGWLRYGLECVNKVLMRFKMPKSFIFRSVVKKVWSCFEENTRDGIML